MPSLETAPALPGRIGHPAPQRSAQLARAASGARTGLLRGPGSPGSVLRGRPRGRRACPRSRACCGGEGRMRGQPGGGPRGLKAEACSTAAAPGPPGVRAPRTRACAPNTHSRPRLVMRLPLPAALRETLSPDAGDLFPLEFPVAEHLLPPGAGHGLSALGFRAGLGGRRPPWGFETGKATVGVLVCQAKQGVVRNETGLSAKCLEDGGPRRPLQ